MDQRKKNHLDLNNFLYEDSPKLENFYIKEDWKLKRWTFNSG